MSAYLRIVEQGERVAVTDRGRVVAEPGPPTHATDDDAYAELRRRARAGTVRLGAPNRADLMGSGRRSAIFGYPAVLNVAEGGEES